MRFAVIRHPDLSAPGTSPESALEIHQAKGWYRVSEWRDRPDAFHLPDFADAVEDLDLLAELGDETRRADDESAEATTTDPEAAPAGLAARKPRKEKTA